MSKMEELTKKMENDTAFVEELKQASSPEELAAKIKAAGFDITLEELLQVLTPEGPDELSDDKLEAAAGGLNISKAYMEASVMDGLLETQKRIQQFLDEMNKKPSFDAMIPEFPAPEFPLF